MSTLFYLNAFCFTFKQKDVDWRTGETSPAEYPHVPFITWPVQDGLILEADDAINKGFDLAVDKSREMGASWLLLALLDYHWIFQPESQILMLSRTEDYVDKAGNHKSLFWKLDYLHKWLPDWMCPPDVQPGQKNRTKMHVHNELNGSTIDGESTTINAARGDRRKVILMDEFAAVENGQAMRQATADVTSCRLVNSTPRVGSEYSKWVKGGQIKVYEMWWWDHPEKGHGRYVHHNETANKWEIRSPWFDHEEPRRSPKEIAVEINKDHEAAGDIFFESHTIAQHKALFARPPLSTWEIKFTKGIAEDSLSKLILTKSLSAIDKRRKIHLGPLKLWVQLHEGRLDQSKNYIFGIDVSKGQGASNSVVSIRCAETGEKIGEWADANTPPYEFARIVVALALWVGGANPRKLPFLVWEANGPGWDFGRLMVGDYKYPHYYRDEASSRVTPKKTKKYGWHSNRQKKEELLSAYRRKLVHGGFINHSAAALEEATTYIYYENGGIGPAYLMEENESARLTHGDRPIADALTELGMKDSPRTRSLGVAPPTNSVAYRRQIALKKKKPSNSWRKQFSFAR